MQVRLSLGLLALATVLGASNTAQAEAKGDKQVSGPVYEMRTYYAAPGKMADLHARFRNHTCKLFEKHGMKLVGFWSPVDPKEAEVKMVYILAYPSRDAARQSWQAFQNDPAWKKAKADSEVNGKLVDKVDSIFLNATDYSPAK